MIVETALNTAERERLLGATEDVTDMEVISAITLEAGNGDFLRRTATP